MYAKERVDNSVVEILELNFCQNIESVICSFLIKIFVQFFGTRFGQDFEVEVQLRF